MNTYEKKARRNAGIPKKWKAPPSARDEYEGSESALENALCNRKSLVSVGYADEEREEEMERVLPDVKTLVKSVSVEEEEEESDKQDDEDMVEEEEEEPILK
jgi:hypothetical protein